MQNKGTEKQVKALYVQWWKKKKHLDIAIGLEAVWGSIVWHNKRNDISGVLIIILLVLY